MSITAEQTHCGQHRKYGDFFREWDIQTDEKNREVVLNYCFDNLYKRRVPDSAEWHLNIKYGGEKSEDANYYFAGYYTLAKTDKGYKFTVCEPYCD